MHQVGHKYFNSKNIFKVPCIFWAGLLWCNHIMCFTLLFQTLPNFPFLRIEWASYLEPRGPHRSLLTLSVPSVYGHQSHWPLCCMDTVVYGDQPHWHLCCMDMVVYGDQTHWPLCCTEMVSWLRYVPLLFWLELSPHILTMGSRLSPKAQLKCHHLRPLLTILSKAFLSPCEMISFHFFINFSDLKLAALMYLCTGSYLFPVTTT